MKSLLAGLMRDYDTPTDVQLTEDEKRELAAETRLPTAREQAALDRLRERTERRNPLPSLRFVQKGNGGELVRGGPDEEGLADALLMNGLGTASMAVYEGLVNQALNASVGPDGVVDNQRFRFIVAAACGMEPQNDAESMLAVQMATVHTASMEMARRMMKAGDQKTAEGWERMATRLTRTFAAQAETLSRMRRGGQQKVTVVHQHVHVTAEQAAVQVNGGGGVPPGGELSFQEQPDALDPKALAYAPGLPLWSEDPERHALPIEAGNGSAAVPDARRG
jgi:hypothetical protein